jgi:type VI secretion system protein ImpC
MIIETSPAPKEEQLEDRKGSEFIQTLKQSLHPPAEGAANDVEGAVKALVEQGLADTSLAKADVLDTIGGMLTQLDKRLSTQMSEIMHASEFQQVESAWRGLKYLVFQSETDATLKIRVLNVSKHELQHSLSQFRDALDESPLFKEIYEERFGYLGGEPFGCLVGDYYFNHMPTDVQLLLDLSMIAGAAHSPFLAGADASLLGMASWAELRHPRDIKAQFDAPEYAAWRSLRDSDDARYLGLCMVRALGRLPYGAKSQAVEEFAFEEDTEGHNGEKYCWMNSAYAMAANINRAFAEYGWCVRIRGLGTGGAVDGLPALTFPSKDGGADIKCPTEIAITDRRVNELLDSGLIPLIHRKDTDRAFFIAAPSLFRPRTYQNNPEATAASNVSGRLPWMFACCRFAHYLKLMVRDSIGRCDDRERLQAWLTDWISEYVDDDPKNSSEDMRRRRPLAGAGITLEDNGGYYLATFELLPSLQFGETDIGLRLLSRLPRVTKLGESKGARSPS